MVRDGMTEALEARWHGGRSVDEKHQLAQAYANRARKAREADVRRRGFEQADAKYAEWLRVLEETGKRGEKSSVVQLAAARVEYAGLLLSGPAASGLNDFEASDGRWGDREGLQRWLTRAREQYEQALAALAPLLEDASAHEEELLAAGVYDALSQSHLDATLNLGWANYYLGVLETKDEVRRREYLATAERQFQELIDSGQVGTMYYRCHLALGMAQRELGRLSEAEKSLAAALGPDAEPVLAAQARYELARSQIKAGKFDEARATLRPLVEKDLEHLAAEDQPAKFYISLAQLWDANSYLVEAEALRADASAGAARTPVLQKSRRVRYTGLAKLKRLAQRGVPWPALVQLYVAASVDTKTPLNELSAVELLYTAGVLEESSRYADALDRLQEAASRKDNDKDLAGDVLFELGRCQHLLKNERAAAETFGKLAAEYRGHAKAAQAATFAYQLWGQVAEHTRASEDYLQLAATLRNLLASFADHPQRDEALWLLPAALELAGRFDEAAAEFAKVPQGSPHWEEAQYRRAVCGRRAVEATRASSTAEQCSAAAHKAAEALGRYADEADARSESAIHRNDIRQWSAEARVSAAELLVSEGVADGRGALAAVAGFEARDPQSALLGRVLAVRIRAYRGLHEFEQASTMLAEFLRAAPPEQVGGTLATLAQGMQDEVERLVSDWQADAAHALAKDALATFDELEKWVRADARRAPSVEPVLAGRARMLYLAGQYDDARGALATLLEKSPKNGNYQHLLALILTARLAPDAPHEELTRAREAWATLLADASLPQRAPERYWEARYNWLALALRLGDAADVERAITQERIWRPELGGPPWNERLEALRLQARRALGELPATQTHELPGPAGSRKGG